MPVSPTMPIGLAQWHQDCIRIDKTIKDSIHSSNALKGKIQCGAEFCTTLKNHRQYLPTTI